MVVSLTKKPRLTRRPRGLGAKKRHLYLTDDIYNGLLVTLAAAVGTSPSDVCEQILRHHQHALALPLKLNNNHGIPHC